MASNHTVLKQTIAISHIYTIHYFEKSKNFVFSGEQHDFWEFLYVDKGEIEVMADTTLHRLKQGTIIFHKPNEFHSFYAYHGTAPNFIVMTFESRSRAMKRFENLVLQLQDEERNLLAQIIKEGAGAFTFPFDYPLKRKSTQGIGCEQMVKIYLEMFLIRLLRKDTGCDISSPLSTPAKEKSETDVTDAMIRFLSDRIHTKVTIEEMSDATHIAKTRLKDLFKKKTGSSIMTYFIKMKIDRAKLDIREGKHNFTEIARMLGFSDVHYFSKTFKRVTNMTPSEYAKSAQARS
ncbi:helix-turn-helix domain-containing protein [Cohnella sp. GCM10027633]|uniref:helix-turn-helix domain-containing protein n=1 Tax=unclassified Cohnella TaxID=2636738 RepID=UPI00362776D5